MKSQAKVKFVIFLALIIIVAMLSLLCFQLVKINQVKKKIYSQQQQISQLQEQLDYFNNKTTDSEHDSIIGED